MSKNILLDESIPHSVIEKDNSKFSREAQIVVTIFSVLVAGLLLTWYFWEDSFLDNEDDLIYNMGLVGGIMMLLQFVYSARKHVGKMRRWGMLKNWFSVHMVIGFVAPIIIIFHSRFDIASINGGVAFFSMLIVVFSGVVGRYLYSQVNFDLTASRNKLRVLHNHLQDKVLNNNSNCGHEVETHLKAFMITAFTVPASIPKAFVQAFRIEVRAKTLYLQLGNLKASQVSGSNGGGIVADSMTVFSDQERRLLREYLNLLAKMARYNAFKRLFSMWRVGHVPLIYLLLITGLAHVLAVHMY